MSPRWLIGMALAFLILGVFANITDGIFLENSDVMPLWDAISHFKNVTILNPVYSLGQIFIGVGDLISAVWQTFTWDFTFLNGDYIFFRWLLITISVGVFIAFMYETFRVVRGSG